MNTNSCYESHSYKSFSNIFLSKLTPYEDAIVGTVIQDFDVADQTLGRYSAFIRYLWRSGDALGKFIGYLKI